MPRLTTGKLLCAIEAMAAAILLLAACRAGCEEQDISRARATQLKAAFLYKFGKFVEWPQRPPGAAGPTQICILEPDPFGTDLDRIAQLNDPSGKEAAIRRLQDYHLARGCDFLYLSEGTDLKTVLSAVRNWSIVTVSDARNFLQAGGIIELYEDNKNISFRINQREAQQEGIKISSKLLALAKNVIKD